MECLSYWGKSTSNEVLPLAFEMEFIVILSFAAECFWVILQGQARHNFETSLLEFEKQGIAYFKCESWCWCWQWDQVQTFEAKIRICVYHHKLDSLLVRINYSDKIDGDIKECDLF
jgi:hypothetical protein